jgi:hypothetical protein
MGGEESLNAFHRPILNVRDLHGNMLVWGFRAKKREAKDEAARPEKAA